MTDTTPQAAQPTLHAIFVPGPDEYHAAPNEILAHYMAEQHNAAMAEFFEKNPDYLKRWNTSAELCRAEVREWPFDADEHAEQIAEFDYAGWGLDPNAPQGSTS